MTDSEVWLNVSCGNDHTCAVDSDNDAWCWGAGGNGVLGIDSTDNQTTPQQIISPSKWKVIIAGTVATCGLTYPDAAAYCWGYDLFGTVGNGIASNDDVKVPTQVAGNVGSWLDIDTNGLASVGIVGTLKTD